MDLGSEKPDPRFPTVLKPFEVDAGRVAPAFGQSGLETHFRSTVPADVLLRRGIIGQP